MTDRVTTRFQKLLKGPQLLVMPGGFSPLMARMAEAVGYQSFHMAGSQISAYIYGFSDVGLLTRDEMVRNAHNVAAACDIPILADADTGYGNALNVYHTVQEYVRAGAAGLHIEDQESPKTSGTGEGKRCISLPEAIGKYKAAVAAKNEMDPDFVVCARCDLIGVEGGSFEAAVERCIAYAEEAKVDAVWINNVQKIEDIAEACRQIPAPVIPLYSGPQPQPSLEQLQEAGAAVGIFPSLTSSAGLQPTWDLLHDFKDRGVEALLERRAADRKSAWGAVRSDDLTSVTHETAKEIEEAFIPKDVQRKY